MSFEYRELGTQVYFGGKGDKSPCKNNTCGKKTSKDKDDDCCANTCGTTTLDQPSDNCPQKRQAAEYQEGLSLLRQQLRDNLAAG
jgi:hypothetical protein